MATEIKRQRILRMQDLPDRIGFRPSTIYELIAKGKVRLEVISLISLVSVCTKVIF